MFSVLIDLAHYGQTLCLSATPASEFQSLYAALVCGAELRDGRARQLFVDTGLIHLIVVSGAHLVFLEQLTSFLPERIRLAVLVLFCWLSGFGPPAIRALTRRVLVLILIRRGPSALSLEAVTSGALLLVYPPFLLSRSFLMSWMCALALSTRLPWPRSLALNQALKCYVLLFVFAPASPLSLAWNVLITPVVGALLFPLSSAVMLLPALQPVGDFFWRVFLRVLESGPQGAPASWHIPTRSLFWVPIILQTVLIWQEVQWRRARAFSSP